MGISTVSIPFYDARITLCPHTASGPRYEADGVSIRMAEQWIDRELSLEEFSAGQTCRLEQVEETGEYIATRADGAFIQGPEV